MFGLKSKTSWLRTPRHSGCFYSVLFELSDCSLRSSRRHNFKSGNTFFEHILKTILKKITILVLKLKSQQSRRVAVLTVGDAPDFPSFTSACFTLTQRAAESLINAHTGRQTRARQTRVVPPTHPVLIARMDISLCCRVNTRLLAVCPSAALFYDCVCHMALSLPL